MRYVSNMFWLPAAEHVVHFEQLLCIFLLTENVVELSFFLDPVIVPSIPGHIFDLLWSGTVIDA